MRKSLLRKVLLKAIGFIVFLAMMLALNVLAVLLPEPYFVSIVEFLDSNFLLLILLNLLFFFGDVFSALDFPLDLPAPIFSAVGGVFLLTFIIKVLELVAVLTDGAVVVNLRPIATLLYILVFILAFFFGYLSIILRAVSRIDDEDEFHQPRMRKGRRR
jgi:hypothetical protein